MSTWALIAVCLGLFAVGFVVGFILVARAARYIVGRKML